MTGTGPREASSERQLVVPAAPPLPGVESLKAVTGSVTCRLVDEHAVLHCKRCGKQVQVAAAPRRDFLSAVRRVVAEHEECVDRS